MPTDYGGSVDKWNSEAVGKSSSSKNAGAPPGVGYSGPKFSKSRPSGMDIWMWTELEQSAGILGVIVDVYEPDYLVQEY